MAIQSKQPRDQVSIAEAKNSLTKLIRRAEQGEAIRLTRRGRTVAVLVSPEAHRQGVATTPSFHERYEAFRRTHDLDSLDIDVGIFDEARDRGTGRDVDL